MAASFVPQIFSIENLVSSKQNPRILKGDKNYWVPVGKNNLADIEARAELDVREEGQPSADWGREWKSQNENADLVFRQWLWPSNTTYKFCRTNFFPSRSSYSMIDCISCAIALDHRICIQNWLAEPAGVLKWQSHLWTCLSTLKVWATRKKDTITYLDFRVWRLKKNISSWEVLERWVH